MNSILHVISEDGCLLPQLNKLFNPINISLSYYSKPSLFLNQFNEDFTGCILLDVNSEQLDPLFFLNQLNTIKCLLPIIVLSGINDIKLTIEIWKLGINDFFLKPYNEQLLIESVQKNIHKGDKNLETNCKINKLTPKEQEVLYWIIEGKLNREIALDLNLSLSTVEAHRRNIMKKLKVKNKAQLICSYIEAKSLKNNSNPLFLRM